MAVVIMMVGGFTLSIIGELRFILNLFQWLLGQTVHIQDRVTTLRQSVEKVPHKGCSQDAIVTAIYLSQQKGLDRT